jgi:hypothetical protein
MTRRSKEELAKAAELFAGQELLDYSEEEVSGDERRDPASQEGEEGMDVDEEGKVKEKGGASGEVFLTPEEVLQNERDREEERRKQQLAKERRKIERELEEARKREDARLAGELGRELGRKATMRSGQSGQLSRLEGT